MKNAGRVGRHDGDGVILGVLLVSLAGPISRFWCGRMRSSGASRLCRPLRRCSGWRRRPPCLTVCRQQLLCAAGAGHGVAAERDPSPLVLRGDDPVCYWLAIPLGRGAAGVLEGRLSASSWPGRRSSSCWNGKRRAWCGTRRLIGSIPLGIRTLDVFQAGAGLKQERFSRGS